MSTAVIIPVREGNNLERQLAVLSRMDCRIVVVADRCDITGLPDGIDVVHNDDGEGFQAGRCRDIGLAHAETCADTYIFLDEDCIPQENLVRDHARLLMHDVPVVTCGKRLEKNHGWHDRREVVSDGIMPNLFNSRGTILNSPAMIHSGQAVWSCNLGMNRLCVDVLRRFMKFYWHTDRIFDPYFDGEWGGEDVFLGYVAWAAKCYVQILPNGANGVMHMDHPSGRSPAFKERLDAHVTEFRRRLVGLPPTLELYSPT